ncbi:AI-2E family transporter [Microbacterium terregens]
MDTTSGAESPDPGDAAEIPLSPPPEPPEAPTPPIVRTVRAGLDHPVRTPFVATLAVMAAIVLGIAIGSLALILVCVVLAIFIALGLNPVVLALERRGIPRGWGIAIVFAVYLLLVIVFVLWVLPAVITQIFEFAQSVPAGLEEFAQSAWVQSLDPAVAAFLDDALDSVAAFLSDPQSLAVLFGGVLGFAADTVSAISSGIIVVVLTLYFLGSLTAMKQTLYRLTAAHSRHTVESLAEQITGSIGSFVLGAVVLAGANAAVVVLLHMVLGLPYPALMGVIAFVVTLVPVIGSVLFWVIGTVLALFTSPTAALLFAILYLVYIQIEAYVVTPRVMSRATAIPGVLVILGALIGGTLLGFLGALVAIPITAAILLVVREVAMPLQDAKTRPTN